MQTRVSKRRLIAATLLVQGVLIAIGGYLTFRRIADEVYTSAERRLAASSTRIAEQISGALPAAPASIEQLQALAEGLSSPDGASIAFLDRAGRIVCHPDARLDASMRGRDLLTGILRAEEGSGIVAMRYIPSLDLTMVVEQSRQALAAAASQRRGAIVLAIAGGTSILILSGVGTVMLIRRYDSDLARINEGLEREVERRVAHSLRATHALILGLAKVADARDADTGSHLDRIRTYTRILAGELGATNPEIDEPWIERLELASCLHDVGKVAIPDGILRKPGRLTEDERRVMQTHAAAGATMLESVQRTLGPDPLIDLAVEVARSHHERWDGTGYPQGLSGTVIPLAARLVALADFYDAMTSDRVYRVRLSHAEVCRLIERERGRHFDPEIVDAFGRASARFAAVTGPGLALAA